MNDETPKARDGGRTEAAVRRSRWPGWIWAIPIAAALLVGWWTLRSLTRGGEDITISFDNVHGMKESGNTSIVYRGFKVGKVTGIKLAEDGGSIEGQRPCRRQREEISHIGNAILAPRREAQPLRPVVARLGLVGSYHRDESRARRRAGPFTGREREPTVSAAQDQPQEYAVALNGSVGRLEPGQAVKLRGFTVGEVKTVGFRYDVKTGAITTPVTLALYRCSASVARRQPTTPPHSPPRSIA